MWQVFSRKPVNNNRVIHGRFAGTTDADAIAAARAANSKLVGVKLFAWEVLPRYLVKQGNYISIKLDPSKRFNEGGISHDAHTTYVNCRRFFRSDEHNELHARMQADGMHKNTNNGYLMGQGAGEKYEGYRVVDNEQAAQDYLVSLAFDLHWAAKKTPPPIGSGVKPPNQRQVANVRVPSVIPPPHLPNPALPIDIVSAFVAWIHADLYQPPNHNPPVTGWDQRIREYAYAKGHRNAWNNVYPHTHPFTTGLNAIVNDYNWATVHGPGDLTPVHNADLLNLAERIRVWGGVEQPKEYLNAWAVIKSAVLGAQHYNAPMNSGWTKVASFATDGRPNAQTIWDSRVSTSIIWRLDQILSANGLTPANILGTYQLGQVPAEATHSGMMRALKCNFKWPKGYGRWDCHFGGSDLVRQIVAILNDPSQGYPRMPLPNGKTQDWDVFGVGLVLFMDGY